MKFCEALIAKNKRQKFLNLNFEIRLYKKIKKTKKNNFENIELEK